MPTNAVSAVDLNIRVFIIIHSNTAIAPMWL